MVGRTGVQNPLTRTRPWRVRKWTAGKREHAAVWVCVNEWERRRDRGTGAGATETGTVQTGRAADREYEGSDAGSGTRGGIGVPSNVSPASSPWTCCVHRHVSEPCLVVVVGIQVLVVVGHIDIEIARCVCGRLMYLGVYLKRLRVTHVSRQGIRTRRTSVTLGL